MQAIITKFLPATNTRPNRIKAFCPAGSVTLCSDNFPFASHDERSHRKAALMLQEKLNWNFPMLGGNMPDGNYCFVQFPNQFVNELENIELIDHPYNEGILKRVTEKYYK
jgi:hypothetical protein